MRGPGFPPRCPPYSFPPQEPCVPTHTPPLRAPPARLANLASVASRRGSPPSRPSHGKTPLGRRVMPGAQLAFANGRIHSKSGGREALPPGRVKLAKHRTVSGDSPYTIDDLSCAVQRLMAAFDGESSAGLAGLDWRFSLLMRASDEQ